MSLRDVIVQRYRHYIDTCNRHAWDELHPFLAQHVVVNGQLKTRQRYIEDLRSVTVSFPDYHWQLLRAVVEDDWLAVHLHDTGTRSGPFLGAPGDATRVETHEFAMYRLQDGLICDVEVTADNARLASMESPAD